MRLAFSLLLLLHTFIAEAQQSVAFTKISMEDGMGLNSNVVYCLQQDKRGFMWVGTGNGLQRFDGSKFINFESAKIGSDVLPDAPLRQIMQADSGKLLLAFEGIREFGLFDPSTFLYKKISFKLNRALPARSQFHLWKTTAGEIYLNVMRFGVLQFNLSDRSLTETNRFKIPRGWNLAIGGTYEDKLKNQIWFCTDSGLVVHNIATRATWHKRNNPQQLPLLTNPLLQDRPSQFYIDKQRRHWIFTWPLLGGGGQVKYCYDRNGEKFLAQDTVGIEARPEGYTEYNYFFETRQGSLWIYGLGVLFSWDKVQRTFVLNKSLGVSNSLGIDYSSVHQVVEDREGSLWIATDRGLYFSANNDDGMNVVNLIFESSKSKMGDITDILQTPEGDYWFGCWGGGIKIVDKYLRSKKSEVYNSPAPASWDVITKNSAKLVWALCRKSSTGQIFIGCNYGVLMIHDPKTKTTKYLAPPELGNSTVRFIAEDKAGVLWIGTQSGRLVKYANERFNIVQDVGSIIYKIFVDKQGWLWLATHEKGLYAINPNTGIVLQHYTSQSETAALYSNTGYDVEQMNDSIIVFGGGCLNFIDKKNKTVRFVTYAEGLPANDIYRLRKDDQGFLWIITINGLSRYNPKNNRITPYSRKDGIMLAEQTKAADYVSDDGFVMFAGGNAVVMFKPSSFTSNQPPPDVSITDFKIFNQYIPVDSLQNFPVVKLKHHQNSFTIYFSSLSYMQRDKLTYYYKLEGRDKNWNKSNRWDYENYSLLPPGHYVFKIYAENIEGLRSKHITELVIHIKPPFWQSMWFMSTLVFLIALLIYYFHSERVKRLLAVEKIRNKVARDLHDDMGSTLSTINILTSMAKTKMNTDPVKTTEYLGKISDNSQRMMDAMDDIVWSIKPSNDNMQRITARMREFATNVLEAKEMDIRFFVHEDVYDVKLDMEARRDFFLVFKEAVNNAAKYSKATEVIINIEMKNRKLQFSIHDDGIGFDVAAADGGNGLGNMTKRAEAMQGQLSIDSLKGKGTTVTLKIPV